MRRRTRVSMRRAGGSSSIRSLAATMANGLGHQHESAIEGACRYYQSIGRAYIVKIPEPFRVENKTSPSTAYVQFIAHAQPDFMGTCASGQSIVFEAKATSTDKLRQSVVTPTQAQTLEAFYRMGAIAGVCASIENLGNTYFIPWSIFRDMKSQFGRQYVTRQDVEMYRVKFNGCAMFLDYQSGRTTGAVDVEMRN